MRTIYVLQGEVKARGGVRLVSQRPAIPRVKGADIWLVVTGWPGVQIDFDSATLRLSYTGQGRSCLPMRSRA